MHPRKIILGFVLAAVVVLLALGLVAARPAMAGASTTTSRTGGPPIGELSGGHYRLVSAQMPSAQTPENVLLGGGYSLRSLQKVDAYPGCCCKSFLPCILK
jgi:hypothetical protein